MPGKYPYVSSPGPLTKAVDQFRKSFPSTVNADTLRKLGLAPNNESYLINTLRFLGLIDDDGQKLEAANAFNQHSNDAFTKAFEPLVQNAYAPLFELHGDAAWNLSRDDLIAFFRTDAGSTSLVGERQAITFRVLAALSGHGGVSEGRKRRTGARPNGPGPDKPRAKTESNAKAAANKRDSGDGKHGAATGLGLSVRVEVNLPATTDQDVYDKIFRSLRENLLDVGRS